MRLRTFGLALTLSALTAAGGYVAGRVQAWTAVRETQAQLQVAVAEHQRAFEKAEGQHRSERLRVRAELERSSAEKARLARAAALLEGHRRMNECLRALDQRNFGVADEARRSARNVLAPLAEAVPELPSVVSKLDELDLVVASDSGAHRQALLSVVGLLEPILDREPTASSP